MDLARYTDLFLAEAEEQLRRLSASLLALEGDAGAAALDEAFRAAHTLKGMAATMGLEAATDEAHALEDVLAELRAGGGAVTPEAVDALLARADALERAVAAVREAGGVGASVVGGPAGGAPHAESPGEEAGSTGRSAGAGVAGPAGGRAGGVAAEGAAAGPAGPRAAAIPGGAGEGSVAPAGAALVARIRISADAAFPAARALLARRNVEGVARVLGAEPAEPGPEFRGELRLFLGAGADRAAVEAAARAAGEIDGVVFERVADEPVGAGASAAGAAGEAAGAGGAPGGGPLAASPAVAASRARHVRVDPRRLDELANGLGELAVVRARIEELVERADTPGLRELVERAGALVDALRETALAMRMVPAGEVFDRFPRLVRDAARALGRDVDFRMEGRDVEIDRTVLDAVAEPLVHLLRNAVDHGIEPAAVRRAAGKPERGRITLRALRERAGVRIVVEDDGAGVDAERVAAKARRLGVLPPDAPTPTAPDELLRLLCRPGLSTAEAVTELSGRGVGLDAVAERVRALGGALELETAPGAGTRLSLRLPATLAVAPALRVRLGAEQYLVPMTHIAEAVELETADVARVRGQEVLRLRGETVPMLRLARLLGVPGAGDEAGAALIAELGGRRRALVVDELLGREQIVMRGFDAPRGMLPHFSGVTLLADGRPALVLDPMTVF